MMGPIPVPRTRRIRVGWLPVRGFTFCPIVLLHPDAPDRTVAHEDVHIRQQARWWSWAGPIGVLAWGIIYVLALPVGWNPHRRRTETEAFRDGSGIQDPDRIHEILKHAPYWLWWHTRPPDA